MDNEEVVQLAETLMKGGLVLNKNEALRMAREMVETTGKVIKQQNVRRTEQNDGRRLPPIMKDLPKEEISVPKIQPKEDPVVQTQPKEDNWTQRATNQITSNNEILKTLDEIGKKKLSDPNDSLNGAKSDPANYNKIENFNAPPKQSDWLPSGNRFQQNGNLEQNREKMLRDAENRMQNTESRFPQSENRIRQPENRMQNTENRVPQPEFNIPPPGPSPEDYTSMNMSGSLNDMMAEEEQHERNVAIEQAKENEPKFEAPEPPKMDELLDVPMDEIEEKPQFNEDSQFESPSQENVPTDAPVENQDEFLSLKNDDFNINVNSGENPPLEENKAEIQPEISKEEEKPVEEVKEPEKKSKWTPEEEKLRDQVDLSKVFNFSNRN